MSILAWSAHVYEDIGTDFGRQLYRLGFAGAVVVESNPRARLDDIHLMARRSHYRILFWAAGNDEAEWQASSTW